MCKRPLIETNPYLVNAKKYVDALITNVSSSTAIETGDSVCFIADTISDIAGKIVTITSPKPRLTSQGSPKTELP